MLPKADRGNPLLAEILKMNFKQGCQVSTPWLWDYGIMAPFASHYLRE